MTTLNAPPATELLPAQNSASSWCPECDGRGCTRLTAFPAGNPRAGLTADEAARAHGNGAHVHYVPRGDQFAVVVPAGEVR
ncbi:hypothetical protein AB0903_28205 [Streptomyces sp. NPDC048389]|uniref:hypothetical protein n=1 Tax=Streptomyces sp. NPDC048389 TaxID=3154622 RepID=UPI00345620CD